RNRDSRMRASRFVWNQASGSVSIVWFHRQVRSEAGTTEARLGANSRGYPGAGTDRVPCEQIFFGPERTTMTRIRPKRQRHVGFEALEGRLALSTGMAVAPPRATAL